MQNQTEEMFAKVSSECPHMRDCGLPDSGWLPDGAVVPPHAMCNVMLSLQPLSPSQSPTATAVWLPARSTAASWRRILPSCARCCSRCATIVAPTCTAPTLDALARTPSCCWRGEWARGCGWLERYYGRYCGQMAFTSQVEPCSSSKVRILNIFINM